MQRACQNDPSPALGWLVLLLTWVMVVPAAWAQEPAQAMRSGARVWAAEQRGMPLEAVQLGELDSRLQVPICKDSRGWQYDFPFAHQDTLRARCATPVSQFYLRVTMTGAKATATSATSAISATSATSATSAKMPNAQNPGESRPVVVLRQGLLRGTRLTQEHLELAQWPAANVPQQSIDNMANAIDAELTRDILAGKPIRSTDLRPALLVKRGQTVTLTIRQVGGFAVVAQVEAMQDGRKDDSIRLKNRDSGRILTGKVVGLNSVEGQ